MMCVRKAVVALCPFLLHHVLRYTAVVPSSNVSRAKDIAFWPFRFLPCREIFRCNFSLHHSATAGVPRDSPKVGSCMVPCANRTRQFFLIRLFPSKEARGSNANKECRRAKHALCWRRRNKEERISPRTYHVIFLVELCCFFSAPGRFRSVPLLDALPLFRCAPGRARAAVPAATSTSTPSCPVRQPSATRPRTASRSPTGTPSRTSRSAARRSSPAATR